MEVTAPMMRDGRKGPDLLTGCLEKDTSATMIRRFRVRHYNLGHGSVCFISPSSTFYTPEPAFGDVNAGNKFSLSS